MEKITIWYSVQNGGDGSAYPKWFLTERVVNQDQEDMDEGWGEPCCGSAETFVESDIHRSAVQNEAEYEIEAIVKKYSDDFWPNLQEESVLVIYREGNKCSNEAALVDKLKEYNDKLKITFR